MQQYLDTKARKKVDSNYIEVPDKPWMVVLRYNASMFDVDYSNSAGNPSAGDGVDWEICFEPPLASSIGVWAGYRGTGIAISKSLHRKKGTTFSFSTTGAKYGINLRLRAFDIDEVTMTSTVYDGDKVICLAILKRLLRVQRAPLLTGCGLQPVRHPASLCRIVARRSHVVYVGLRLFG